MHKSWGWATKKYCNNLLADMHPSSSSSKPKLNIWYIKSVRIQADTQFYKEIACFSNQFLIQTPKLKSPYSRTRKLSNWTEKSTHSKTIQSSLQALNPQTPNTNINANPTHPNRQIHKDSQHIKIKITDCSLTWFCLRFDDLGPCELADGVMSINSGSFREELPENKRRLCKR